MKRLGHTFAVGLCLIALGAITGRAAAQGNPGPRAIGLEIGMPLVLGVDLSHRLNDRWRVGLGLGRLSGLTAIRAEAQWLVRPGNGQRLVPLIVAGGVQYFLKDGDLEATPVGLHAAIGLDYHAESPVSFAVRLGGMKTFGSSGAGGARVFGVENGFTTGIFNIGARFHF